MGLFWRSQKGFTIIEVLVACAILITLTSIIFANVNEGRKKARDTQRESDIAQIQLALRLYKDSNGAYPTGYDTTPDIVGDGSGLDPLISQYLGGTIRDPLDTGAYRYRYDTDHDTCSVSGVGANKKILYVSMERASASNWTAVCGGTAPGANTYVVILQ